MSGRGGHDGIQSLKPRALRAEKARLARRLKSIHKHRQALDLAIEENFDGELAADAWRAAFESDNPHDSNRTMIVTANHSALLNSLTELLKASAGKRLLGLLPYKSPRAEDTFAAVHADGGFDDAQLALLNEAYALEGRIEHASPDVTADEVREMVIRVRQALPGLIESTRSWLEGRGIGLSAD